MISLANDYLWDMLNSRFPAEKYSVDKLDKDVFFIYKRDKGFVFPAKNRIEEIVRKNLTHAYRISNAREDDAPNGLSKGDMVVRLSYKTDGHIGTHAIGMHPAEPAMTINVRGPRMTLDMAKQYADFAHEYFSPAE